jgi:hypothetical protein
MLECDRGNPMSFPVSGYLDKDSAAIPQHTSDNQSQEMNYPFEHLKFDRKKQILFYVM